VSNLQLNTIQAYDLVKRNTLSSRRETVNTKEAFKSALKEAISHRSDKTKTDNSFENNAVSDPKEESVKEIKDLVEDLEKRGITTEDVLKLIDLMGINVFIENKAESSFNIDSALKSVKSALDSLKDLGENTLSSSGSGGNAISKVLNEFINAGKVTSELNINEIINKLDSLAMGGRVEELNMMERPKANGESISSEVIFMELNKADIKLQEDKNVILMKDANISNEIMGTIQSIDIAADTNKENVPKDNKESFTQSKGDLEIKEVSLQIESKEEKLLKTIANSENKADHFSFNLNKLVQASDLKEKSIEPKILQSTMANDVVKVIKHMEMNQMKELTVKITPENLGEITIKITSEGGVFKAVISAGSKETYSLLNANASEIKNGLNNSPIKVQEVTINIYNEDTTFFSDSFNNNEFQRREHDRNSNYKKTSIEDRLEADDMGNEPVYLDGNLSVLA
jgi:flagellar hook-length control protein FliK